MQRKGNFVPNSSGHKTFAEVYMFILMFPGIAIEILSEEFPLFAKLIYENMRSISTVVREFLAECTPRQKSIRALEIFRVQKLILNATS